MSDRRQQINDLKKRLKERFPHVQFRARWGRGTASHWITVCTDAPDSDLQEIKNVAAEYAGSYWSDSIPGEARVSPCVSLNHLDGIFGRSIPTPPLRPTQPKEDDE